MRSVCVAILLFVVAPVLSVRAATSGEDSITNAEVSALKPGEYLWKPWLAADGALFIAVNLATQRASVYRGGVRIGAATISSGKRGHRTPAGVFRVLAKDRDHRSKKYKNAPMPFMLRLTWGGIALHGGAVRARPSSHGCVRLPRAFAKELFYEASIGTPVTIVDSPDEPPPVKAKPPIAATKEIAAADASEDTSPAVSAKPKRAAPSAEIAADMEEDWAISSAIGARPRRTPPYEDTSGDMHSEWETAPAIRVKRRHLAPSRAFVAAEADWDDAVGDDGGPMTDDDEAPWPPS